MTNPRFDPMPFALPELVSPRLRALAHALQSAPVPAALSLAPGLRPALLRQAVAVPTSPLHDASTHAPLAGLVADLAPLARRPRPRPRRSATRPGR